MKTMTKYFVAYSTYALMLLAQSAAFSMEKAGLYNPADSRFYLKNRNEEGPVDINYRFGPLNNDWLPISGDWDNDGIDTVGLYDSVNSQFYLRNAHEEGPADISYRFGPFNNNWLPISGDWDNDGIDTVGLYDSVNSQFYLRNAHEGGPADISYRFGPLNNDWLPISGDWDNDGIDTVGLYDSVNSQFYLRNAHEGGPADISYRFGPLNNDWLPISGDWDNDGIDTVGLYDSVNSQFYLRNAHEGGTADVGFSFGPLNNNWLPLSIQAKKQSCDEAQALRLPSARAYYDSRKGTTRSFRIEAERLADGNYHQFWFDRQAGQLGSHKLVTITQCPNEFDTFSIDRKCWEEDWTATILMRNQKGVIGCFVEPGMDYFINIIDLDCKKNCGYVMTFR